MPDTHALITLYGISNCDQVKKARRWLERCDIPYVFHDLRRDGINATRLDRWLSTHPWDTLVNRRGTTWRELNPENRPSDRKSAVSALLAQPTLLKRPVLETGATVLIGFSETEYQRHLSLA